MKLTRLLVVILAAAAVPIALAACGSSSSTTGGDATSASTPATTGTQSNEKTPASEKTPTGQPIKVMVISPVSTPLQNFPEYAAGAMAAANSVNAAGGIDNRPVEISTCNDESDPNTASQCARSAVSQKVTAVILYSLWGSNIYPILAKAHIPVVANEGTTPADFEAPNSFPLAAGSLLMYSGAPFIFKETGKTTLSGVVLDVSSARDALKGMKQATIKAGLKWGGQVIVPENATDYAPYAEQINTQGADGVMMSLTQQQIVGVLQASKEVNLSLGAALPAQEVVPETIESYVNTGQEIIVPNALPPVTSGAQYPGVERYNTDMDAAEKAGVSSADVRDFLSLMSWLAVRAIQTVGEQVSGTLDASSLMSQLNATKTVNVEGILNWAPGTPGPPEYPRLGAAYIWPSTIENGEVTLTGKPFNVYEKLGLSPAG